MASRWRQLLDEERSGWNATSDEKLFNLLEGFAEGMLERTQKVKNSLSDLVKDADATTVRLNSAFNALSNLSTYQFIANSVPDEESVKKTDASVEESKTQTSSQPAPRTTFDSGLRKQRVNREENAESREAQLLPKYKEAIRLGMVGLKVEELLKEASQDEVASSNTMGTSMFRGQMRKLPHIINSQFFYDDPWIGLYEDDEQQLDNIEVPSGVPPEQPNPVSFPSVDPSLPWLSSQPPAQGVPQAPVLNMAPPPAPLLNIPQAPPLSVPQAPPLSVPQAPPLSVPQAPPLSVPQAPPLKAPQAPPLTVPSAPPLNMQKPSAPPLNLPASSPPANIAPPDIPAEASQFQKGLAKALAGRKAIIDGEAKGDLSVKSVRHDEAKVLHLPKPAPLPEFKPAPQPVQPVQKPSSQPLPAPMQAQNAPLPPIGVPIPTAESSIPRGDIPYENLSMKEKRGLIAAMLGKTSSTPSPPQNPDEPQSPSALPQTMSISNPGQAFYPPADPLARPPDNSFPAPVYRSPEQAVAPPVPAFSRPPDPQPVYRAPEPVAPPFQPPQPAPVVKLPQPVYRAPEPVAVPTQPPQAAPVVKLPQPVSRAPESPIALPVVSQPVAKPAEAPQPEKLPELPSEPARPPPRPKGNFLDLGMEDPQEAETGLFSRPTQKSRTFKGLFDDDDEGPKKAPAKKPPMKFESLFKDDDLTTDVLLNSEVAKKKFNNSQSVKSEDLPVIDDYLTQPPQFKSVLQQGSSGGDGNPFAFKAEKKPPAKPAFEDPLSLPSLPSPPSKPTKAREPHASEGGFDFDESFKKQPALPKPGLFAEPKAREEEKKRSILFDSDEEDFPEPSAPSKNQKRSLFDSDDED